MNLLGNIVWLLLGGLAVAVEYFVSGLALCLTIVGIPFGIQALKLGLLALLPFGQTSVRTDQGFITIVGIPFGRQHFKLMSMALTPFGRNIVPTAAL